MANSKKNGLYEKFIKDNLPVVPNFVETNRPKFDPGFKLGPPVRGTHEKNLLEFYFQNDVRYIQADMHGRPEHYTQEQKDIIEAISLKRPLPPGTTDTMINDIVMRYTEKTEHRKKREQVIQKAQKSIEPEKSKAADQVDDPTIDRILKRAVDGQTFEDQAALPKAIKII